MAGARSPARACCARSTRPACWRPRTSTSRCDSPRSPGTPTSAWRSPPRSRSADRAAVPLRLVGTALYLDRYWREERGVAADLLAFADAPFQAVRDDVLSDGL